MSFSDYAYEEMMVDHYVFNQTVERCFKQYSPQKVIIDSINSFRNSEVNEEKSIEVISRDILKTVARTKHVSSKQRKCLIKMLVLRGEMGYEY